MVLFSCCRRHKEWICCSSTTWTSCRSLSGNGLLLLQFSCYCSPSAAAETGHAKDSHCGLGVYIISACFNCNWILLKHLWKNSTHVYQAGKCSKSVRLKTCYYCLVSSYQLNAHFLYSITIYMLHYNPQHVSSSTLLIFRRTNCIITAFGIVTLCKRPYSMPVESGLCVCVCLDCDVLGCVTM